MKKYLPSKEFLKFFGIAIAIGLVLFFGLRLIKGKKKVSQDIQSIATRQIIEDLDTDSDGVKDWEEGLWGMDLDNPDSDDDGILDGQEVEIRKQEIKSLDSFVDVSDEPETETERLARQIATVAFNLNQINGGVVDQKQIAEMVSGFVEGIKPETFVHYTIEDLTISSTKSAQSYYNEMTSAIGNLSDFDGTELAIVEKAIFLKKESVLKELEPIIVAYSEAPQKVLKKEIPSAVAEAHLNYLNALTQKAIALFAITKYFEDPIIAIRGMNEFVVADQNLTDASEEIISYLQKNAILN